ncbi:MAG: hypothetical protein QOK78_10655, partial [Nitrososphaeraceae archaeon]|nr:hypothetical protein [Nitrososphaeraceae archaeon]
NPNNNTSGSIYLILLMNKREKFKNLSIDSIKKWIPVNHSVSFSLLCIFKCSLTKENFGTA